MHIPIFLILPVILVACVGLSIFVTFVFRRVVPTNMVHIVQSGRSTTSYGKGRSSGNVYYEWPAFLPFIGVSVTSFPESVFVVGLDNYAAYDFGRLPFMVDVRAFFRISDSDIAANRVAMFAQLHEQLTEILRGAVRRVLAEHKLEEILGMRAELGKTFTSEVNTQMMEYGVSTVKTIEFMDMRDAQGSTVIHDIMAKEQSRIQQESRVAIAGNAQIARQREIDAQREVSLQEQSALQTVGERTAMQEKLVGIAREVSQQEVLAQSKITAGRERDVQQVNEVRTAEIDRSVAEITADQKRKVMVVEADAERQRLETVATGQLEANKREAEGVQVKGLAAAAAEAAMLMAPVTAQTTLAKEIGSNEGYQTYLVRVRQVEAAQAVGVEQAKALGLADIKVIANGGTVTGGLDSIGSLLSAQGGVAVGAMLEGFKTTEAGAAVISAMQSATKPVSNGATK